MKKLIQKILRKMFNISSIDMLHNMNNIKNKIDLQGYLISHTQMIDKEIYYYMYHPILKIRLCVSNPFMVVVYLVDPIYKAVDFYMVDENYIVIDFGLNRGYSALYFAQFENCKKVYGYELVNSIYQKALHNISLNPHLAHKIESYNVGIADEEKDIDVWIDDSCDDGTSIFDFDRPSHKEKAHVVKTHEVCSNIINKHLQEKKVLKFNIEGAEYMMLDELIKNNLIQEFDMLIGTFHDGTMLKGLKNNAEDFCAKMPENFEFLNIWFLDTSNSERMIFLNKKTLPHLTKFVK